MHTHAHIQSASNINRPNVLYSEYGEKNKMKKKLSKGILNWLMSSMMNNTVESVKFHRTKIERIVDDPIHTRTHTDKLLRAFRLHFKTFRVFYLLQLFIHTVQKCPFVCKSLCIEQDYNWHWHKPCASFDAKKKIIHTNERKKFKIIANFRVHGAYA